MRIVVQRVKKAEVRVEEKVVGAIGNGLLVFLGIHSTDTKEVISWMVQKVLHLRLFADEAGKMNLSLQDIQGEILVVSQFTLYGNCQNGRRPDFFEAAPPLIAEPLYLSFCEEIRKKIGDVQTGNFGSFMEVALVNDGPVTFLIEKSSGSI